MTEPVDDAAAERPQLLGRRPDGQLAGAWPSQVKPTDKAITGDPNIYPPADIAAKLVPRVLAAAH